MPVDGDAIMGPDALRFGLRVFQRDPPLGEWLQLQLGAQVMIPSHQLEYRTIHLGMVLCLSSDGPWAAQSFPRLWLRSLLIDKLSAKSFDFARHENPDSWSDLLTPC